MMTPGGVNALMLAGSSGYQIQRSLRFRSSASAYLNRTFTSAATWTFSGWVKRGALSVISPLLGDAVKFLAGDTITAGTLTTTAVFRDGSAFYHIVASNSGLYVNGAYLGALTTSALSSPRVGSNGTNYFDGYLSEVNFIDGQSLTPSSFGEISPVTGQWQAKKYAGTYGTNGFYLPFTDNSAATATAIGADKSGNGNNWTPNNMYPQVNSGTSVDSMLDVPLGSGGAERGNYCVMNPLESNNPPKDGNLQIGNYSVEGFETRNTGTIAVSSGKYYFEATVSGTYRNCQIGLHKTASPYTSNSGNRTFVTNTGQKVTDGIGSTYGNPAAINDVIGCAFDLSAGMMWFSINGVWQAAGNPNTGVNPAFTDLIGEYAPWFSTYYTGGATSIWHVNFGQRPFASTPPTGFKALHTGNLPDPVIKLPNKYFDASLYTGNGTTLSVVNSGMQPDLVWVKARSSGTQTHKLADSVRGGSNGLTTNNTAAEIFNSAGLTSFDAGGFSIGSQPYYNTSASSYVAWQWKKDISAGFDVVTYTGTGVARTVAHGLGVAPKMIITKGRATVGNWWVYHASLGNTDGINLNLTTAKQTFATLWNNTTPTSAVFSLGAAGDLNGVGAAYVAYVFSEVAGYSKFGSYTGNGSADGAFVYCGFRPRFVMIKRTDTTSDWTMLDTTRDTYNVEAATLLANTSAAETSVPAIDGVSTGFKCRSATVGNVSGGTYIFAAFAESAAKFSLAR